MDSQTSLADAITTTSRHLKSLREIGVQTVGDLLNYFPRAYTDFSQLQKINQLTTGETQTVAGVVQNLRTVHTRMGRTLVTAKLIDETGSIALTWFNSLFVTRVLRNGDEIALTGRVQIGSRGGHSLIGGTFEKLSGELLHSGRIIPIYRTHGKLISSKWLREKIYPLLSFASKISDPLPSEISVRQNLLPLGESIAMVHFPQSFELIERARQRLAFDELFFLQLSGLRRKLDWQIGAAGSARGISYDRSLTEEFFTQLPFTFTSAQEIVTKEILTDLKKTIPMNRLLEGDVGSGKTIVAALAIFLVTRSGGQATLLAPTEILAAQHFRNFLKILHPLGIRMELLTGSTTAKSKKEISAKLRNGELDLVVGTHALLELHVQFRNLDLAVIDEQHRFGVKQRTLLKKGGTPHVLAMTATPIPRTLALTIFGDQDVSIIDQLPPGRKVPLTRIIPKQKRNDSYRWIESEVQKGRQIFIVCPLVEESEILEIRSAKKEFKKLKEEIFPRLTLGLLHGKMRPREKDVVMQDFVAGKIQILVATTVVEVGIDVPNATVMLIEAADRFGLAQLHQLRGRVGRGAHQSYCFLFSDSDSEASVVRLHALEKISNGFELAEMDLKLRGPGEVFGMRQSGIPDLKMAKLTDHDLIKRSRKEAEKLLEKDAKLKNYPQILWKLDEMDAKNNSSD